MITWAQPAAAAVPGALSFGLAALSHGMNTVSKDPGGETSAAGTVYYNLDFQYHWPVSNRSMISPRLIWMPDSLKPNEISGTSVKTSFMILALPWIYNLSGNFDFGFGPALVNYSVKGAGGNTEITNGTSTSVFTRPGQTRTAKTISALFGTSYFSGRHRLALDFMIEGAGSNTKRNYSTLLGYSYALTQF